MSDHDRRGAGSPPVLDIGAALDLLTAGLEPVGLDASRRGGGIPADGRRRDVPIRLTLGARAVLDAARRAEERGLARADALAYANRVASRYLDLLPDAVFAAALTSSACE